MISSLVSLGWLLLPPLSALAAGLLWRRSKLWGLIPIAVALVLLTCFVLMTSFSEVSFPLGAVEEERRIQWQFMLQFIFGMLLAIGCLGLIWQCSRDIWPRRKEPIQPPQTTTGSSAPDRV